jgi:hypothetical protein
MKKLVVLLGFLAVFAACTGDVGPRGWEGPQGPQGPPGATNIIVAVTTNVVQVGMTKTVLNGTVMAADYQPVDWFALMHANIHVDSVFFLYFSNDGGVTWDNKWGDSDPDGQERHCEGYVLFQDAGQAHVGEQYKLVILN